MKKLIALILIFSVLFTAAVPATAEQSAAQDDPVIIVPGLMETLLAKDVGTKDEELFYAPVFGALAVQSVKLVLGLMLATVFEKYDLIIDAAKEVTDAAVKRLAMNPDGTSVYPLTPFATEAADSTLQAAKANGTWKHMKDGAQHAEAIAEKIGADRIFIFSYDWRLCADDLAERLRGFIADVKALTGSEKVDVYANSYGCQVTAQYLYAYGGASEIDNIVFNCPAFAGTKMFPDLLSATMESLDFDFKATAAFLVRQFRIEADLENIVWILPDRIVRRVVYACIQDVLVKYLISSLGFWGCCPVEDYEALKAMYLDDVANAAVIEKSDAIHAGVLSHLRETLKNARDAGIDISIVAGAGTQLTSGNRVNGDATVDVVHATGGKAAVLGETLPDDPESIHRSPYGTVDLTDGYLPDNTWVIQGMFHGQSAWDRETQALVLKLLLTDELPDVFSDPLFPQFTDAHCRCDDVSLLFSGTGASVLRASDGEFTATLRNNSEKHIVAVSKITVAGGLYTVKGAAGILLPGGTREVTFVPAKSPESAKTVPVTVRYAVLPAVKVFKTRTVTCTVL